MDVDFGMMMLRQMTHGMMDNMDSMMGWHDGFGFLTFSLMLEFLFFLYLVFDSLQYSPDRKSVV